MDQLTKDLIIENLQENVKRINKDFKHDEDFSWPYIDGLMDGIKKSIKIISSMEVL